MEFRLLGPLEALRDGHPVPIGGAKQRGLLALLLLHANEVVSRDRVIEELWTDAPPGTTSHSLNVQISRLRKTLEPDGLVATRAGGYVLEVEPEQVDACRFERLLEEGRQANKSGRPAEALALLEAALKLWRGGALAEFAYEPFARAEVERLEELRLAAIEERIDAELALGRHDTIAPELEALTVQHPLRERLRRQQMLALYRSGRQAEALETYHKTRRRLVDELGIEPGPALHELEQAILRHEPAIALEAPPGVAEPARERAPSNLPWPPTPFIGRTQELNELVELIRGGSRRLITLTGAGGSGKTRLAIEAARELLSDYPDGIWWLPLQSVQDPALVLPTIAGAIGTTEDIGASIGEREMLLVLDNFEQLLDAGPATASLLTTCPNLALLVTSREPLHVAAERQYHLLPMTETDAVTLFAERAAQHWPEDVAAKICRRLDCLPLAVELAAARTTSLTAQQVLDRLDERLALLDDGPRDAPLRQQTLRATIAWSYDLLDPDEQTLFARLGVFAGGCALEAAKQIADADLDTLHSLVGKSLLRHTDGRFWMLETIREYATERLLQSGEEGQLAEQHAVFFAVMADDCHRIFHNSNASAIHEAEEAVGADASNIVAAIEWARDQRRFSIVLRLLRVGRRLRVTPERKLEWIDEVLDYADELPRDLQADAYSMAGRLRLVVSDFERATALLQQAAAWYEELGNTEREAMALGWLGAVYSESGKVDEGRAALHAALALAEQSEGIRLYSILHYLGELEREHGNPDDAAHYLQRSIELAFGHGDVWIAAHALHGLGDLHLAQGNLEAAEDSYRQSLTLSFETENDYGCNYCLRALAATAALTEDARRAGILWGAADAAERAPGYITSASLRRDRRNFMRYEAMLADARGPNFDAGETDGRQMTLDQAVAYAVGPGATATDHNSPKPAEV